MAYVADTVFSIKGTAYYQAQMAWESGWLQPNAPLALILAPDNPYDRHAVQIWLLSPRVLLGYVPRAQAPVIEWQLKKGHIRKQCVHHVSGLTQPGLSCKITVLETWQTPWRRLQWRIYQAWWSWRHRTGRRLLATLSHSAQKNNQKDLS